LYSIARDKDGILAIGTELERYAGPVGAWNEQLAEHRIGARGGKGKPRKRKKTTTLRDDIVYTVKWFKLRRRTPP